MNKTASSFNKQPTMALPFLSPAARKIAAERNIDPSLLQGTGKHGRITKQDALAFDSSLRQSAQGLNQPKTITFQSPKSSLLDSLPNSIHPTPFLTAFNEVDMSQILALVDKYQNNFQKRYGIKLGPISFLIRACVRALKTMPTLNGEIKGNEVFYKEQYHLGIDSGTHLPEDMLILKNADRLGFSSLEKLLASHSSGSQQPETNQEEDVQATFILSTHESLGPLISTPFLPPFQLGSLGIYKIENRPFLKDAIMESRPMMYIALTYDPRVVSTQEGTQFLHSFKKMAEDPLSLMFDL